MNDTCGLFVYGTLMRGEANASFLASSRFIRTARTAPQYTLIDLGAWPGMLAEGSQAIVGEIFEVSSELLYDLDAFEEVPDVYVRLPVNVEGAVEVQAYFLARYPESGHPVPSGDWHMR